MRASRPIVTVRTGSGAPVCDRCLVAHTPAARLRGLLGRRELAAGEGILLRPAASVHTLFMRFAIDVVFLDRDGEVLRTAEGLSPWRAAGCRGARCVLELAAGECARVGVRPGMCLAVMHR